MGIRVSVWAHGVWGKVGLAAPHADELGLNPSRWGGALGKGSDRGVCVLWFLCQSHLGGNSLEEQETI